jgi:prephenate dehydrogenase
LIKFDKITIIGVGLIGGSFAKGLKKAGLVEEVVGFGRSQSNLKKAVDLEVIDRFTDDIADAVSGSELVFLAVPLGVMADSFEAIKPHLAKNAIVTDAGSSKSSVVLSAQQALAEKFSCFVPGHPIAGKEQSGVEAADEALYVNHRVILTPIEQTNQTALTIVEEIWSLLGANVEQMAPQQHDEIFAATSHLPHLLAFGLVEMLHEHPELGNVFHYTAGGFKDFTRIASSDAEMWRDIAVYNSDAIVKWLKNYGVAIQQLAELVENKDAEALYNLFSEAKQARDEHILQIQQN